MLNHSLTIKNLRKLNLHIDPSRPIFTLICGDSKGFMKALKGFIKPFCGTTKKCENKNLSLFFSLCPGSGRERLMSTHIKKIIELNQTTDFLELNARQIAKNYKYN